MRLSKETKVGILAVVSGALLFFGVNYLKGEDVFSPRKKYFVVFKSVDGLVPSNPVLISGINVGKVGELKLLTEKNNQVLASLEVNKEIVVGDSTVAILTSTGLLGTKAITLTLGRNSKIFDNGDTLAGFKEKAISETLSEKALPIFDNLDSTVVKLNKLLGDQMGKSIKSILNNAEAASTDLRITISQSKNNLVGISANLNALSSSLKETEKSVKPLIYKMGLFADSLNDLHLKAVVSNANKAMENLSAISTKIDKGEGSLGALINDKSFYNNLNSSSKDLDNLLIDMKAHPKRYIHFSVFGKKEKVAK